ncbi:hypothetical protein SAMN05444414_11392 [Roseovarius marisflavi]|uniref:Uncharacterized protein n=1 Tax=Roseovarius marisflavi TaxID=1054996 RepID=A0A1M7AH76_9RHOB|nr:hypothetical protein SAMN05444414_11392 [Roseovarius marisflavi]
MSLPSETLAGLGHAACLIDPEKARRSNDARVIKAARSSGEYVSPGYLPPCSDGRGSGYAVDLKAIEKTGKVLDEITNFDIGKY